MEVPEDHPCVQTRDILSFFTTYIIQIQQLPIGAMVLLDLQAHTVIYILKTDMGDIQVYG